MSAISLRSSIYGQDSNHIYYDLDIINNDTKAITPAPLLRFTETRNNPFLMDPSQYFASVIRFQCDTSSLPLFIPLIETGQPNVNKTVYSFTLSFDYMGTTYQDQRFIEFSSQNKFEPTPNPPINKQDLTTTYYFVNSYTHWTDLMNNALQTAFTTLNALVVAAGGTLPTSHAPFLEYDPYKSVWIFNADKDGYARTLSNPIKVFMNSNLYYLLGSFDCDYLGFGPSVSFGKNRQINIYSTSGTNIINLGAYSALQMYQEYPTTPLFNPIESIVFTTSLLPITPSLVSLPSIFGDKDTSLQSNGNNSNLSLIITDLQVPLTKGWEYKPNVLYIPQGEYRLLDLFGNNPISSIDLTVFWKDHFGNLHPFILDFGASASLKLMFRKKAFNNL